MPLSPDEIRNVYNNEDEATATELMAGDREDVKNFNENVVSPSKTFNALSQNVLYAPFTNGTHKYFDVLENAYVPAERSISKDFSRSMIKDELNERRNKLITEANKESDPALKESMLRETADITKRLSYLSSLPETENLDAFASILRGIKRSAPSFAAGTAASLVTGGSSLVGVGVTAFGNFLANKELNYNEAYAGSFDAGLDMTPEERDRLATKSMYVTSFLDGFDVVTGIGGGALKIAREWGNSAISREFRSELKKKLAKETLLKAAGSVAKSAAKEAAIEGATEVVQDKSRERIMRGDGAISSVGYAVGDFVGAIGRTIAGTATPEDKEAMKTFRSVFFASLVFSGGMNSVHKFAPRIYSAVKQNQVEKSDRVYFDNMKKIGLVQPAVDIVDDVMDTNNKRPEYRYADAKKLQTVLEEDLQREDLSDAQRTREEDLLRRSIEAQKTTGQVELTAKEHADTFLDPLNETLFQKTNKQTFFVDPESIYDDYSLEQLTLQAVEEIDKEALSEGSAFMDVYNVLKESGQAADSELIANSLQHHALLTTAATAQEKTYSDLKAEYGLKLNAEAKEAVNDKDVVKGVVSGEVSRQGNEIMLTLTKDANPTTFSHESFHLFELIMGDAFKGGKLTPYWAKQMQKLYKAAGIDDLNAFYKGELGGNVRIERAMKSEAARKQREAKLAAKALARDEENSVRDYKVKPAETLYGDVQERLAEAWTEYLQTGESPKKAYETMFAKFKELFAPIYKNFVRQGALNKSIREVYDRIFLSYEEAKEVARERRIGLINRPAGVDDETWGKYTAAKKMAIARSSDGIVKAIRELSQMKNDEEYQAELAKVRERLEAELANDKQFQMQDYLLTKDAPKIKTSEVSGLDVGWYNKKMTAKDGMTLDEAVDFLNMQFDGSIDASDLLGILTGPTREQYIDMQADRAMNAWMRGRYPELFARISAESTMNNMSAIDAVLYEYMFLSNDTGMKINKEAYGDIKVMFERAVEKTLEETPVKRMSSEKYKKMLLGNALKQRAAGESKAKLAELKYQQAILMRLAELSADVEKDVNSLVKMSQKYKKSLDDSKQRSAIDADSRELIRSIFNDAGVSKMSLRQGEVSTIDKLANWVSEYGNKQYRNENDIDIYSELVPLLQKVEGIGYRNLNASELRSLKEGLMFIKNVSEESRLEKMRDIVAERDADATEFEAQLAERGFKQDVSEWTKHKLKMVSVPILLKSVLPESLHQKYLRPFFNGIIASNNAKKADFERIAEIFGDEVNRLNDKFVYNGIVMTRENLLVMMLNTGTVHNVRTLATTMLHNADRWGLQVKNKNRFTEDEIQSAINLARDICASAPDNFADIVSDIWALIDSKKEGMRSAYKHVTNNLMKFEQIEQLDGVNPKLKGGYYPIHRMYLTKTQDDLFSQNFRDTTAMSTVSSLKDRGDATATDLSLTLDGLNQWVETTERYSNVAVPYYELASFFNQQKVAEALGKDYSKVISDWMQNADRPLKTLSVIKTLNVLTDVKVLGFSPIKMMRQYSGILFAAGDVGYRNVLQSFGEYMTDANRLMHPIEEAQKLSPYMRDRYSNYAKTVLGGEAVARESQKGVVWRSIDKALDKVSPVALCLLTMADAQASTIVWEAQYDKSIRAGKTHAEAVFDADSVVMRTQGDASSYSRPEIMRGEMRFFMKYMTYFTSVYSSLFSSRMYGNNAAERMRFAITLANATIICTLYESVINTIPQLWSDDDDDDETFYRKWLNEIGSTAGNVMLPLFGLGQSAGRVLTGQRVYAPSFVPLTPVFNFFQKANRVMNKDDAEMADYVDLIMTASPIPKDISRWVTEELR